MDNMKLFRHKATGKVGLFPDHFEDYPYMELVDPTDQVCDDCVVSLTDTELPEKEVVEGE